MNHVATRVLLDGTVNCYAEGIIQVRIPLPFSLKYVNSYLLENVDGEGYTLFDPGLHTPEAVEVWQQVLPLLAIEYQQIHTIVLTHQHPDHYGLAGWFQQRTGAKVLISQQSHEYALGMWDGERPLATKIVQLFAEHGMPVHDQQAVKNNFDQFVYRVLPHPQVEYIEAGQQMVIGRYQFELIDAPGHARGQLCFYDAPSRIILCGDQVLPRITPNVSYVPGEDADPLARFIQSLEQLATLDVAIAFPGHRQPFTMFQQRIHELVEHHQQRVVQIKTIISQQACTSYELCLALFGEQIVNNPHHLRFAMAETLAHVIYMENQQFIVRHEAPQDRIVQWSLVE